MPLFIVIGVKSRCV